MRFLVASVVFSIVLTLGFAAPIQGMMSLLIVFFVCHHRMADNLHPPSPLSDADIDKRGAHCELDGRTATIVGGGQC